MVKYKVRRHVTGLRWRKTQNTCDRRTEYNMTMNGNKNRNSSYAPFICEVIRFLWYIRVWCAHSGASLPLRIKARFTLAITARLRQVKHRSKSLARNPTRASTAGGSIESNENLSTAAPDQDHRRQSERSTENERLIEFVGNCSELYDLSGKKYYDTSDKIKRWMEIEKNNLETSTATQLSQLLPFIISTHRITTANVSHSPSYASSWKINASFVCSLSERTNKDESDWRRDLIASDRSVWMPRSNPTFWLIVTCDRTFDRWCESGLMVANITSRKIVNVKWPILRSGWVAFIKCTYRWRIWRLHVKS